MCHSAFFPYASSAVRDSLWQRVSATARLAIKSHHSAESFGKQVFLFEGLHLSSHQSSYILVLVVGEEVRSCRFHIPEFSFRFTKVQTNDGRNHLLIQPMSRLCTFILFQLRIFAFNDSYISFRVILRDECCWTKSSPNHCKSVVASGVQTRTYA